MSSNSRDGSLWMGDICEYMDETFIQTAFSEMGETVSMVRIIKNKSSSLNVGYCFVHFPDESTALRVLHKLNGKMIPNSQPPTRFMLNHSSAGSVSQRGDFSLFVGDLEPQVDDELLYKTFASRYSSIHSARVIYDKSTKLSRGYAFVRFGSDQEHKHALTSMNGFTGLGTKPIRVSMAAPKKHSNFGGYSSAGSGSAGGSGGASGGDYSGYYEQYWYNYPNGGGASNWPAHYGSYDPNAYGYGYGYGSQMYADENPQQQASVDYQPDDDELVDHETAVDPDSENMQCMKRSEELWDALDSSRWLRPDCLNNELGIYIKT